MRSEALCHYERLLVRLHAQTFTGALDGPEAETIREEMDPLWPALTESERRQVDDLSEDLYELAGKRRVLPAADAAQATEEAAHAAYASDQLLRTLEILRSVPHPSAPDRRTYLQGRCWERIGFPLAAARFYAEANRRSPRPVYLAMEISAIGGSGDLDELLRRIDQLEKLEQTPASVLNRAALQLHQSIFKVPDADRPPLYQRVIRLVERAERDPDPLVSERVAALIAAGFSHVNLGHADRCRITLDRAVQLGPFGNAYAARGLIRLEADRAGALGDFQVAVSLQAPSLLPYLELAHDSLRKREYPRTRDLCRAARQRAPAGHWRGRTYEWEAIASAELGHLDEAAALFDLAIAEDPLDPSISENAARFARRTHTSPPEPRWEFREVEEPALRNQLESSLSGTAA